MQILVLGMHRSGTSVVARLLNMMGVYFAPEGVEMAAHVTNPKGFWERKDVNELCIRLLKSAKCDWHRLSAFSIDRIPPEAIEEFREGARRIILGLDAHRPWFLKEPRLCILAPLWLELLEMPICLFVHRSPLEVAKSLETRDGFSKSFGLALWERYATAALNATRKQRRLQINHAQLISDPLATVHDLAESLEALGVDGLRLPSAEEILVFVDPSLYRAKKADAGSRSELSIAQRKLWDAFESGAALRSIKQVRFSGKAERVLIEHDKSLEIQTKIAQLEARNLSLSTELSQTRTQLARHEHEARLLKASAEKADRSAILAQQMQDTIRRGVDIFRQTARSEIELQRLREDLARAGGESKRLREAQTESEFELQRHRAEITRLGKAQTKLECEMQRSRAEKARLRQALDDCTRVACAKIDELTRTNRILKKGLDKIEKYFSRLGESRSFHFMVYTVRRLGLVSRTPRRCVESIKDQFPAIRKAIKQARVSVPSDLAGIKAAKVKAAQVASPESKAVAAPTAGVASVVFRPAEGGHNRAPAEGDKSVALTMKTTASETALRVRQRDEDLKRKIEKAASFRVRAAARHSVFPPPPGLVGEDSSVCFIVLHRSGENHLHNLFSSFLQVNTLPRVEFRVMLHACADKSREVIESFQNRLNINVTEYEKNHSFAYSNNRAAEQTAAEYLVFLNNDIIFEQDVVAELLRILREPRNGIVGVRLFFPPDHPKYPRALQHGGIKFQPDLVHFFHRPWNVGVHIGNFDTPPVPEKFPAITAALAACRRKQFLEIGGFCEDYFYGYEDVDLCLSLRRILGLRSISANHIGSIHNESATGSLDPSESIIKRRTNNITHLVRRHGWYLRRQIGADKMSGNLFFSDRPLTLAFAVTEATPTTAAGDFFTASELGEACAQEFGWNIRYLSRHDDWYDLKDVDVLVVLLDKYELPKMRDAKPDLVKVAWLRNWFERWVSRPDFEDYDLFLCSSRKSTRWLRETQRKPAWVFPLATNVERFIGGKHDGRLSSDYCFTGNYWRLQREIESALQPQKLNGYKFAVFGVGWDSHPKLGPYAQGFLPYSEMPNVYASTRIVVDDANHVTKSWGSVNSRVFDALAAGALVITNNETGAAEVFNGDLPTYRTPEELQSLLRRYLEDQGERERLVHRLREYVFSSHTYRHRARTFKKILLTRARRNYRIAIKVAAPTRSEIQHWGDYHFARSLGHCFAEQGHSFRIDCIDEWERSETFGDDVVIALRGLSRYRPKPGQINLMWNISHPDKIEDKEYEDFDHVFVASRPHAIDLARRLRTAVSALLQCTDPYLFYPDPNPAVPAEELLFVGNSRKQYREAVRFAIEAEMPIGVYGTFWAMFIPTSYIRGEYIENSVLRQYYSRSTIVLNDHWPSMRERGFISNRLFDAAAAGAFLISDAVEDGAGVFGEDLVTYRSEQEFRKLVAYYLQHSDERREKAARLRERILGTHTFANRATDILRHIRKLDSLKRSGEALRPMPAFSSHD